MVEGWVFPSAKYPVLKYSFLCALLSSLLALYPSSKSQDNAASSQNPMPGDPHLFLHAQEPDSNLKTKYICCCSSYLLQK